MSLALALTEKLLAGEGAWRVHGGGFAGTIQAYVPLARLDEYRAAMEKVFGEGACYVLVCPPGRRHQGGAVTNNIKKGALARAKAPFSVLLFFHWRRGKPWSSMMPAVLSLTGIGSSPLQ